MAQGKRKKTSRAERKVKTQNRQNNLKPAAPKRKSLSFDQIAEMAGDRKRVLHLGCRHPQASRIHKFYKTDDWFEIRLDKNPVAEPHLLTNMNDLSMIPDESVDVVYTSHNLDSLKTSDIPKLFEEAHRIMRWGGQFVITVPDMQTVSTYAAHDKLMDPIYDSSAGPVAPIDVMYGFRPKLERGEGNVRQTAFSSGALVQYFREASYTNIIVKRSWIELWASAFKYPENDPRRRETVEQRVSEDTQKLKMPAPLPLNRVPHPGQFAPNILSDELDLPPKYWKPLGISKK